MDGKKSPVGDMSVCYEHSAVTHRFPESPISNSGNNSVTQQTEPRGFFCACVSFQLSVVGGFSFVLFLKQLPWETGKVKQLMRCHLMNSLLFSHTHKQLCRSSDTHAPTLTRSLISTYTHNSKHLSSGPCQAERNRAPSKQAMSCCLSHAPTVAFQGC